MKIISPILLLSLLLFSCNSSEEKSSLENKTEVKTEDKKVEEHNHTSDELQLNDGQKWKIDANMIVFLRNMENAVIEVDNSPAIDSEIQQKADYTDLSKILLQQIDSLTSNCTMKGQAHDELHKWLVPFIDEVNYFSEAENNQEAREYFIIIKEYFIQFNEFFE